MTSAQVLGAVIRPTLAWMGWRYLSPEAQVMLLVINQQEDAACTRCQTGGPARGLWQMEPAGVQGVLAHDRSAYEAYRIAVILGFGDDPDWHVIATAMETDDRLACSFARLLLWTDPHPLPALGDPAAAWALYLRLWRPGRPRPADWPNNYRVATLAERAPPSRLHEARHR